MAFSTIFFDLDDTLYPSSNGLWVRIRQRMNQYMLEKLDIPEETIPDLRQHYFETYGTTLRGLQAHFEVEASEFLDYVHDLPVDSIVHPDPELRDLVDSIPMQKCIFTNADHNHAARVLDALGLSVSFDIIIDVVAMDYECKPNPMAYSIALTMARESDPGRCVYLDDSIRNLTPAYDMGWHTVLVGGEWPSPVAHHSISRPHELKEVMPELWSNNGRN
jgi:putative hydrolase of the HAD superfamily